MTRYRLAHFNHEQQDKELFTLDQLLDRDQPYKELKYLYDPNLDVSDNDLIRKMQGSLIGLAVGDALGAPVEFRPYDYLRQHPVTDMQSGGTWGLEAGQWTDDTSMALCLAASLIVKGKSDLYDQFARYKRWHKNGYLSSTGKCFDIGKSTSIAIAEFENRQRQVVNLLIQRNSASNDTGPFSDEMVEFYFYQYGFDIKCGTSDSAGNGGLMRLAPLPLFYFQSYDSLKQHIEESTKLTHGDQRAVDACRFYGGLIWYALNGFSKKQLLHPNFYQDYLNLSLHKDVLEIARGSYKHKKGYDDGIRGKGYVLDSLEAALWAFYNDGDSFENGVLAAVNIGDDTDTTAAIYGELAGAVYGIQRIPDRWIKQLFEAKFIMIVAKGLYVYGKRLNDGQQTYEERRRRRPSLDSVLSTREDRNASDVYLAYFDSDPYRYSTPHFDHSASTSSVLHARLIGRPDSRLQRHRSAIVISPLHHRLSTNSEHGSHLSGYDSSTSSSHRRQPVRADISIRSIDSDTPKTISHTKQTIKVINEH
jgi:ADP-ribosyl-[dinitrogen reductase] hydrolase